MRGPSPYGAVTPKLAPHTDPILAELCQVASAAAGEAWRTHSREELLELTADGADGTPSYLIDVLIEEPIVAAARRLGVNLVSEEVGVIDLGAARTVFIDPLDGSANAGAGVPLSCFSACLAEDGQPVSALTCWLEMGTSIAATVGESVDYRTTGRQELAGAAVSLLRPKMGERGRSERAWWAVAERASRVRILSSSCLEAMLVAQASIDAFVDPGSDTHRIVDLAAAMVFVPAAGGAVVDAFGRPLELDQDLSRRWSGVVASSPALAEELADTIATALPDQLGQITAQGETFGVRRALRGDLPALRALLDGLLHPGETRPADDDPIWRQTFDRLDAQPNDLVIVVNDSAGKIVATVQYNLQACLAHGAQSIAWLEAVVVHPDYRGRGLGHALMDWLAEHARRDGATSLRLTSNLTRERSIAFYQDAGFVQSHAGLKRPLD